MQENKKQHQHAAIHDHKHALDLRIRLNPLDNTVIELGMIISDILFSCNFV